MSKSRSMSRIRCRSRSASRRRGRSRSRIRSRIRSKSRSNKRTKLTCSLAQQGISPAEVWKKEQVRRRKRSRSMSGSKRPVTQSSSKAPDIIQKRRQVRPVLSSLGTQNIITILQKGSNILKKKIQNKEVIKTTIFHPTAIVPSYPWARRLAGRSC